MARRVIGYFFFFNDTATTEIYTLSLHDALPIFRIELAVLHGLIDRVAHLQRGLPQTEDRKSTRLNSSHGYISYAVFCLKKKKALTTLLCFVSAFACYRATVELAECQPVT